MHNNLTRFSNRVDDYIKYRPHYPLELIQYLEKNIQLNIDWIIADIGSGTGISCLPFLENGNRVIGIEPNQEMRLGAESILNSYLNFTSVDGTAENTMIPDESVNLIFCGQAFHWFDKKAAKKEFNRVLRPKAHLVLCWNQRDEDSPFQIAYDNILKECVEEYHKINHRNIDINGLEAFISPKRLRVVTFPNSQNFDLEGLKGRLRSSSYCPTSGQSYDQLMIKIEELFNHFETNGEIKFDYKTNIYHT